MLHGTCMSLSLPSARLCLTWRANWASSSSRAKVERHGSRLEPDEVRIDFVAAWQKKELSVALKSFLDLLDEELPDIWETMKFS
jgi:hypothetical protein